MKPIKVVSDTEYGDITITVIGHGRWRQVFLCQDAEEDSDLEECVVLTATRVPQLRLALRKLLNRLEEDDDDS